MASWRYAVGNLCRRAAAAPVAVSPAVADSDLPLANLADDYPDTLAGLQWRSDGSYAVDLDLNLLAATSSRADAPTGWLDLLYLLANTPGLPADAPDWGTYDGRTALRCFRPVVQQVDVMPGETVRLSLGVQLPAASDATGVMVRVVDVATGKGWEGGSVEAWADDGVVAQQTSDDTWLDVTADIAADAAWTERRTYRVSIEPIAASYGPTTYAYASSPALFGAVDLAAIIGHNLPAGATVTVTPQPSGTAITLTPAQPSMYAVAGAAQLAQTWRLEIQMPTGVQPRPVMGELWLGSVGTLLAMAPVLPISLMEESPGQLTVEGGRRRLEIVPDTAPPVTTIGLQFKARTDAAYQQIRDGIARLTRFGADPLLLLPGAGFEGTGRLYHGRIENKVTYSRTLPDGPETLRIFTMPMTESPFASS
jgi:hypothetical protein